MDEINAPSYFVNIEMIEQIVCKMGAAFFVTIYNDVIEVSNAFVQRCKQ